jgi:hypothetical protein
MAGKRYFSLFYKVFHSRVIENHIGFTRYSIAHFLQKVNANDCSKVHFQDKSISQCVIVQSEVFGVNIAILPIYAKSLMIQVIRPFLIYAVVIHLYFVVV